MKKKLLLSVLGMTAVSSFGQGAIKLDNYNTSGPYVTYGAGWGALTGTGLGTGWTMGFYYWNALGNFTGSTFSDPSGFADPTTLGSYLLATGAGSTATFGLDGQNGAARAGSVWAVPIAPGSAGGATVTLMIVAYVGSSYMTAWDRNHSAPFTLVTSDSSSPSTIRTGTAMPGFTVPMFPEPSALALAGLGGAAWLLFRRCRS